MKQKKKLKEKKDTSPPPEPEPPKKPVAPPVFTRPPLKNTFSQGSQIRQDGRGRYFSRVRRGI